MKSELFRLGDEPGGQERESVTVQVPHEVLSRGRGRRADSGHHAPSFLSASEKRHFVR